MPNTTEMFYEAMVQLGKLVALENHRNGLLTEQNKLLARIAFAAEEANRNNPLTQLDRIMAAAAPEETMR